MSASSSSVYRTVLPAISPDAAASSSDSGVSGSFASPGYECRRHGMSTSKREVLVPDECVGQLGQRRPSIRGARLEARGFELGACHRCRDQFDGPGCITKCGKYQRLEIVLRVHHIAKWCVVHSQHNGRRLAQRFTCNGTRVLDGRQDSASAA